MINYKIETIDNFLNQEDFEALIEISKNLKDKDNFSVFHNAIDKNNKILENSIDSEFLKKLNENYFLKGKNVLKNHCPEKIDLIDYSDFTIIKTKKNSSFPIHDDTPNKLLSGVIYLRPSKNFGTFFYDNKRGKGKHEVEWLENRAVFFSRIERETWHSYKGDKKSNRIVMVYNLMTNRIKEVFKAEKKSYLIGNLRYKLNPYIYRVFKRTI